MKPPAGKGILYRSIDPPAGVAMDPTMTTHVKGTFEIQLAPLDPHNRSEEARIARMAIDKQFRGDLDATSRGEMLSAGTLVKGSAGYVAVERVTGTLQGRRGSFTLQHNATMMRGAPYLNIIVVPDSGTGELKGITGTMSIRVENGIHYYDFEYSLALSGI